MQLLDEALRSRGINVHYTSWLRWIRSKALPAKKLGGRFYIDLAELDAWITAQAVAAVTAPAQPTGPRVMRQRDADIVLDRHRGRGRGRPRKSVAR